MNYYGIRALKNDEKYEVGDYCRNSYDWNYANDAESDIQLNGTCCVKIDNVDDTDEIEYAKSAAKQYGGNLILIGGNFMDFGVDEDEIIIKNAVVVKKF